LIGGKNNYYAMGQDSAVTIAPDQVSVLVLKCVRFSCKKTLQFRCKKEGQKSSYKKGVMVLKATIKSFKKE